MTTVLTIYVLIWPVLVACTLFIMCAAVARDAMRAKKQGKELV